jgi:hypothetical protein
MLMTVSTTAEHAQQAAYVNAVLLPVSLTMTLKEL